MTPRTPSRLVGLAVLTFAACAGCGSGKYSVTGRVTYEDGSPVEAGTVIGETTVNNEPVSVQGVIEPDGTFEWGTDSPGDGVPPGLYRVLVMPVSLGDSEIAAGKRPAVAGKYTRFDSSGITIEVKPQKNTLDVKVSRPSP